MKTFSIQKQLLVRLMVLICCAGLLGLLLTGYQLKKELNNAFDSALQETAERILPLALVEIFNREETKLLQQLPALTEHQERLTYRVLNAAGQVLLQSHTAQQLNLIAPLEDGFINQGGYRIFTISAVQKNYFIQVSEPIKKRNEAIINTLLSMILPLLMLLPLSLIVVVLVIGHVIKPIQRYGEQVSQRSAGYLSPIEPQGLPKELHPISVAVNQLMARLSAAIEAERQFTANAAHELRTPLATLMAQAQRLEKTLHDESDRQKAKQLVGTLNHLINLSDKLLQLAKADSSKLLSDQVQNLQPLLAFIVKHVQQEGASRIRLQHSDRPIQSYIDPDAFFILVKNLLENAMKYGKEGEQIQVSMHDGELRISNDCDPLPADTLAHLRERFYRASNTTSGSGLGLAIVDAIVTSIGGQVQIHSPVSGACRGFEVIISIPVIDENQLIVP